MNKALHLIYITGLHDERVAGQTAAVSTWRLWGVTSELFQVNWADKETWESKLKRLLARIDASLADNKRVGLVAVSAGASAAINAYGARASKLVGCVLIEGKINRPESVGGHYKRDNPAFMVSISDCQAGASRS